jgi:SecD/SecF fusion protein
MQNKAVIRIFAILLGLACLFHLTFTVLTNSTEAEALELAGGDVVKQRIYLDSIANDENHSVIWDFLPTLTYAEAKKREMNLGLDLRGGINVTLEASLPDLLRKLANNPQDPGFEKAIAQAIEQQKSSQENFVDLFGKAYQSINPGVQLAAPGIFGHANQKAINGKMSNKEVLAVLQVEADLALSRTFDVLDARINNFGMTQANIQKVGGTGRIRVELPGVQNETQVRNLLEAPAKLEFWLTYDGAEVLSSPGFQQIIEVLNKESKLAKGIAETDTNTTDSTLADADSTELAFGAGDTSKNKETEKMGDDQDPGPLFSAFFPNIMSNEKGENSYGMGPIMGYTRNQARDTIAINALLARPDLKKLLPADLVLRWSNKPFEGVSDDDPRKGQFELYALRSDARDLSPALEGDVVVDARFNADDKSGGYEVLMEMNGEGASRWAKITDKNKGKSIAIVLDNRVYSAPTVQDKISGGSSSITGNFTFDEAKSLASILKSGKLPTRTQVVELAMVGPSLGSKARTAGVASLVIAFFLVLAYMVFYYGKSGWIADLALLANLFFLMGTLAGLGTTLTLAGITGIVLTIGMAVDANVLIFERIREEIRGGKGVKLALADGYASAYRAIIDSNITTALIAVVLIAFGAGPVRGFAITLFIGILTSLFSAIFLTRLIFEWQLEKGKSFDFASKVTSKWFTNMNINFVGRRKLFYVVSGVLMAAGFVSFATKGFNLGVDLNGGRAYVIAFDNSNFNTSQISDAVSAKFDGTTAQVKYYGDNNTIYLVTKYRLDEQGKEVDEAVKAELYEVLKGFYTAAPSLEDFSTLNNETGIEQVEIVGPTIARDVAFKSVYAVLLSLVIIFIYILIRFKGWQYGTAALLALVHDVVLVLAVFSIFDGLLPFSLEIDQGIIAAVLTVIGYSINDTVIIFDRIREYLKDLKNPNLPDTINKALNSTLGRTINTSTTTMLVLLAAFLFGGEGIKGLSFAILIGVVVGTYSSICIASPMVIDLKSKKKSGSNA